jgi:2,3-bisphosphoglycerate-dependent phosphoglycerate mutase
VHVLLIRHGQKCKDNTSEAFGGLTQLGIQEAELAAEALVGQNIERLFSSPFQRAIQTAVIISRKMDLAIEIRHRIHERSGPSDRETRSQMAASFPEFVFPDEMPEAWWPHSVESWADVRERVRPFVEELLSLEDRHERIAVVAHGGSMDAVISLWLYCSPIDQIRFQHHNCAFTLLSSYKGRRRVHYVNRVAHLGQRDPFFY